MTIEATIINQFALFIGYMAYTLVAIILLLAALELVSRCFAAIRRRFRPQPTEGALGDQKHRRRASAIWEDDGPEPMATPATDPSPAPMAAPANVSNPFGPPDWLRREQEAAEAAHMARQSSVASTADSDAATGEQAAPDASRLQSMAWAAGEVPLTQPKPAEGA